jgi:hypothetical protein
MKDVKKNWLMNFVLSDGDVYERYSALCFSDVPEADALELYIKLMLKEDPIRKMELFSPDNFKMLRMSIRPLVWADIPDWKIVQFLEEYYRNVEEMWKLLKIARKQQGYA